MSVAKEKTNKVSDAGVIKHIVKETLRTENRYGLPHQETGQSDIILGFVHHTQYFPCITRTDDIYIRVFTTHRLSSCHIVTSDRYTLT